MHRRRAFGSPHHIRSFNDSTTSEPPLLRTSPSSLDGSILFVLFALFAVVFLVPRLTKRSVLSLVQKALHIDLFANSASRKTSQGSVFCSIYSVQKESFSLPFSFKQTMPSITSLSVGSGRNNRASSSSSSMDRSHLLQASPAPLPRYSPIKPNFDRQAHLHLPCSIPQYTAITIPTTLSPPPSSSSSRSSHKQQSSRPSSRSDATDGQKRRVEGWRMPLGQVLGVSQRPRNVSNSPFFLTVTDDADEEFKGFYAEWRVGSSSDDVDEASETFSPTSTSDLHHTDNRTFTSTSSSSSSLSSSSSSTGILTPPRGASFESDRSFIATSTSSSSSLDYLPNHLKEILASKIHHPIPQLPSGTFVSPLLADDWTTNESFLPLAFPLALSSTFTIFEEEEQMAKEVEAQRVEIELAERGVVMSLELL